MELLAAKWPGKCRQCNAPVSKGETIGYVRECGKGRVLCETCAQEHNRRLEADHFDAMNNRSM